MDSLLSKTTAATHSNGKGLSRLTDCSMLQPIVCDQTREIQINKQTRQTFPKLGWGPGPPPGRRGRCNAEQRTPSSPSGPFDMSSTRCHSATCWNFHKYIHCMLYKYILAYPRTLSTNLQECKRNNDKRKRNKNNSQQTEKVAERNSDRKKNLRHPPRLAGDVLVMYEFLQLATVSLPPFTFKSKAAPPNCASMWVTFSWSSDGSWEPLSTQGKCKSSNIQVKSLCPPKICDVHPGRKARHVFDRYTSIQSRMILAVEAKANGTKQEGTANMSNTFQYPCIHKSAGVLRMVLLDNMDITGPNRLSLSFRHNPLKPMHSKPPLAFALQKARSFRFFHCSLPVQHKRTTLPWIVSPNAEVQCRQYCLQNKLLPKKRADCCKKQTNLFHLPSTKQRPNLPYESISLPQVLHSARRDFSFGWDTITVNRRTVFQDTASLGPTPTGAMGKCCCKAADSQEPAFRWIWPRFYGKGQTEKTMIRKYPKYHLT